VRWLGRLLAVLVLVVSGGFFWARLFAGGPIGPIPGGHIGGEPATPPADWDFANRDNYLLVESDAWILPYSARVWFLAYEGRLYLLLPSFFGDGLKRRLDDDPHVRVGLSGKLYDLIAVVVAEPRQIGTLLGPVMRRQFAIEIDGEARRVGKAADLSAYRLDDPSTALPRH
jgi:hypothetical protein